MLLPIESFKTVDVMLRGAVVTKPVRLHQYQRTYLNNVCITTIIHSGSYIRKEPSDVQHGSETGKELKREREEAGVACDIPSGLQLFNFLFPPPICRFFLRSITIDDFITMTWIYYPDFPTLLKHVIWPTLFSRQLDEPFWCAEL